MGAGGGDWREIARSTIAALRRRPRVVLLAACLAVLVGSWSGTIYFADRLVSTLPDRSGPLSPLPLSADEIQEQIKRAQELNDELRAHRAAARAYTSDEIGDGMRDTVRIIDEDSDVYPSDVVDPRRTRPAPTEFVATDAPAEPVYTVAPEYPDIARASGAAGTVVVQVLVGRDGRVEDTRVLKSIPALDDAAEQAVRRWRFKPALSGGSPVETWVSVPILFRR